MKTSIVPITEFSGLNNIDDQEEIGITNFLTAENVDVTRQKRVVRRNGYSRVFSGNISAISADKEYCLFISDGELKQLNSNYTSTTITTVSPSKILDTFKIKDAIYWTNGIEIGYVSNYINYPIAPPTPLDFPVITETSGNLLSGYYLVAYTYLNEAGVEGAASYIKKIEISGGIAFSDIVLPDGVSQLVIYVSNLNSETLYRALITNESSVYLRDVVNLKHQLRTQYLSPMPAGHLMDYFRGRLLVAAGEYLYFSEAYNFGIHSPLKNFIHLNSKVTNICSVEGGVYVSTENGVGFLSGVNPMQWNYLSASLYGVANGLMTSIPGEMLGEGFANKDKVCVWPSEIGLFVGDDLGSAVNLTNRRFHFPSMKNGSSAVRIQSGQQHLIFIGN